MGDPKNIGDPLENGTIIPRKRKRKKRTSFSHSILHLRPVPISPKNGGVKGQRKKNKRKWAAFLRSLSLPRYLLGRKMQFLPFFPELTLFSFSLRSAAESSGAYLTFLLLLLAFNRATHNARFPPFSAFALGLLLLLLRPIFYSAHSLRMRETKELSRKKRGEEKERGAARNAS